MNTTTMLIKTDKETKLRAQKVAENLGIPLSTMVNAFLRQMGRDKGISFSIEEAYVPNARTVKAIKQAEKDWKNGKKNYSPVFTNAKDALAWLKK